MNDNNTNIYNNLIKLTRNKSLYINLKSNETFADRIVYLLLHFSFFIKVYKENNSKKRIQKYMILFLDKLVSIRELGYGDVSINKNMKKYVNYFYNIIGNIDNWEKIEYSEKETILTNFINNPKDISFFINYFDKLFTFYKNNTLNFFTKDIEEFKI